VKEDHAVTTTYIADDAIARAAISMHIPDDTLPIYGQDIDSFMQKPLLITSGLWSTANTAGTLLVDSSIATYLVGNSFWRNKMQGFRLVRGTAVFRLVINANPFQCGRLLLHYIPSTSNRNVHYLPTLNHTLYERTQHPGIELDCRETAAIIKIPYITPVNFAIYTETGPSMAWDWGHVYTSVLDPLKVGSGGTTTVEWSLYLSFEDFELAAPIVPQGAKSNKKFSVKKVGRHEEQNTQGAVSSALSAVSTSLGALSMIPALAPMTEPAAWVASGLSGVASFFGWSKPRYEKFPQVMSRRLNHYMSNYNGEDYLPTLAVDSTNKSMINDSLSVYEGDEMSWNFLKSRTALFNTFAWVNTATAGTALYTLNVSPSGVGNVTTQVTNGHTATIAHGPPIVYLSQFFQYYRGSIDLIFKLVKTEFHSGRLEITYTPDDNTGATLPTLTTSQLALRHIIDIREGTEFCLNIPYLSALPYINMTSILGRLTVRVLNELRAPETASQTINVLMFARGGRDLEFQMPKYVTSTNTPFAVVAQMEELTCDVIGGGKTKELTLHYSSQTIGESFSSFKQLLNRYSFVTGVTDIAEFVGAQAIRVNPWFYNMSWQDATTGVTATSAWGNDWYSRIAPMYAFYKGSARLMVVPIGATVSTANAILTTQYPKTLVAIESQAYPDINPAAFPASLQQINSYGGVGMHLSDAHVGYSGSGVPYYCKTRCSNVQPILRGGTTNASNGAIMSDETQPDISVNFANYASGTEATFERFHIFRSMGDDFQFSFFITSPPFLISNP